MTRLFFIRLGFDAVVAADDADQAVARADALMNEITNDPPSDIEVLELEDGKSLPDGWLPSCIPWGERERTIAEIRSEHTKNRKPKEEPCPACAAQPTVMPEEAAREDDGR